MFTVPEGVTKIADNAFFEASYITEIQLPDSVKEIGSRAFAMCSGLQSINIPRGVTVLKAGTFQGCRALSTVTLTEGLRTIKDGAFASCSALETLALPDSVDGLTAAAFCRVRAGHHADAEAHQPALHLGGRRTVRRRGRDAGGVSGRGGGLHRAERRDQNRPARHRQHHYQNGDAARQRDHAGQACGGLWR